MTVVWIAGLLVLILIGFLFALALCRCAMLADRDVEQHLADIPQSRTKPTAPEQQA